MDSIFSSVFSGGTLNIAMLLLMFAVALITGLVIALFSCYKSDSSKGFFITLTLLPVSVAMIIALVNGNIGAGVAVAGAFSLIRFRSAQGKAKEICSLFIAMACGLAFGVGYLAYGVLFALVACVFMFILTKSKLFELKQDEKQKILKITVTEDTDFSVAFNKVFNKYTSNHNLLKAKTIYLGSMLKLSYDITLKDETQQKQFLDELRCLNGNLEVMLQSKLVEVGEL